MWGVNLVTSCKIHWLQGVSCCVGVLPASTAEVVCMGALFQHLDMHCHACTAALLWPLRFRNLVDTQRTGCCCLAATDNQRKAEPSALRCGNLKKGPLKVSALLQVWALGATVIEEAVPDAWAGRKQMHQNWNNVSTSLHQHSQQIHCGDDWG